SSCLESLRFLGRKRDTPITRPLVTAQATTSAMSRTTTPSVISKGVDVVSMRLVKILPIMLTNQATKISMVTATVTGTLPTTSLPMTALNQTACSHTMVTARISN